MKNQTKPLTFTWENIKVEKQIKGVNRLLSKNKSEPIKKIIKDGN
jgi:hypothetical protein